LWAGFCNLCSVSTPKFWIPHFSDNRGKSGKRLLGRFPSARLKIFHAFARRESFVDLTVVLFVSVGCRWLIKPIIAGTISE
jgi:hypothetical protein